jgi:hypothetical protein
MARAREVAAGQAVPCSSAALHHGGAPGNPANRSAKLPARFVAVYVFRTALTRGSSLWELRGVYRLFLGRWYRHGGCGSQSHLRAVFLAKVDMDGVLDD